MSCSNTAGRRIRSMRRSGYASGWASHRSGSVIAISPMRNRRHLSRPIGIRRQPSSPDGRPPPERVIMVYAGQRHIAANLGLAALRDAHVKYFVRGQNLVRVVATSARSCDGDDITLPAVLDVPLPLLGRALGQSARWMRHDAKGRVLRTDPPLPIVQQIGSMVEDWPFPPLHGLLTTPTLRPDGSLLRNPGYDHSTGLFLALPNGFELPPILERPSRRHAESGLELLLGLLPEFDFDSDASRSVALSLLISPIVRASMTTCRST